MPLKPALSCWSAPTYAAHKRRCCRELTDSHYSGQHLELLRGGSKPMNTNNFLAVILSAARSRRTLRFYHTPKTQGASTRFAAARLRSLSMTGGNSSTDQTFASCNCSAASNRLHVSADASVRSHRSHHQKAGKDTDRS